MESVSGPMGGGGLITDRQVRRLLALMKTEGNLEIAAAKAGMDAKTARKYRRAWPVPSEVESDRAGGRGPIRSRRSGRRSGVAGGQPRAGSQDAVRHLQRRYPGVFRTVSCALAAAGEALAGHRRAGAEVFFAQEHHPGRLAASDFTHMKSWQSRSRADLSPTWSITSC